jgi:hypothetical protein
VEFGVRGAQPRVSEAIAWLKAEVENRGFRWTEKD